MHVIALNGDSGAGKDTLARHLRDHYGYTWLSFASRLRSQVPYPAGMSAGTPTRERDTWERENGIKDEMIISARKLILRDPFVFIRDVQVQILEAEKPVVISDLRSLNELNGLSGLGVPVWACTIQRPQNPYPRKALDSSLPGLHVIRNTAANPVDAAEDMVTQLCHILRNPPTFHGMYQDIL